MSAHSYSIIHREKILVRLNYILKMFKAIIILSCFLEGCYIHCRMKSWISSCYFESRYDRDKWTHSTSVQQKQFLKTFVLCFSNFLNIPIENANSSCVQFCTCTLTTIYLDKIHYCCQMIRNRTNSKACLNVKSQTDIKKPGLEYLTRLWW